MTSQCRIIKLISAVLILLLIWYTWLSSKKFVPVLEAHSHPVFKKPVEYEFIGVETHPLKHFITAHQEYRNASLEHRAEFGAIKTQDEKRNIKMANSTETLHKPPQHEYYNNTSNKQPSGKNKKVMTHNYDGNSTYHKRKALTDKVCKKYRRVLKRPMRSDSFVWEPTHHIGYCKNAKAGTSSWLIQFLLWSNHSNLADNSLSAEKIHFLAQETFPVLSAQEIDLKRTDPTSFTFTVVRHPFTRIVSAYRDKMSEGYRRDLQLLMMHKNMADKTSSNKATLPTFRQFLTFIVHKILKCRANEVNSACLKNLDVHWMPYFERCSPCGLQYNIISKMETFDEDMNYIKFLVQRKWPNISSSKINKNIKFHKSRGLEPTLELAKKYYKTLTTEERNSFFKAYYFDFILYDYKLDEII